MNFPAAASSLDTSHDPPTTANRSPTWLEWSVGALIALFIFSGRWSLGRVGAAVDRLGPFGEPRFWLLAALIGLSVWMVTYGQRRTEFRLGAAAWLLLSFLGFSLLSALWAPDPDLAFYKAYELVLMIAAMLSLATCLGRVRASMFELALWRSTLILGTLLAVLALTGFLSEGGRIAVLGGGPNVFVRHMGILAVASLYFWSSHGGALRWILLTVAAALLGLLTGSRGGMVGFLAAMAIFAVLSRVPSRRALTSSTAAVLLMICVLYLTPLGLSVNETIETRFIALSLKGDPQHDVPFHTAGRSQLYVLAWELGKKYPVIGAGLAAFPALGLGNYPHNLFLEAFAETGALGVTLLLLATLFLFIRIRQCRSPGQVAATSAAVLYLTAAQFSGDLFDSRGFFIFAMLTIPGRITARTASPESGNKMISSVQS